MIKLYKRLVIAGFCASTCGIAGAQAPAAPPISTHQTGMSRDQYKAEEERIDAEYKAAKAACDSYSGNAKDVCTTQAESNRKVAKAELDVRDKGTADARRDAMLTKADADYAVAKEKCGDRAGNAKDACIQQAKAVYAKAKADADARR